MIYSYCLVVIVMGGRAGAPAMHVYHTLELKGKKKRLYLQEILWSARVIYSAVRLSKEAVSFSEKLRLLRN